MHSLGLTYSLKCVTTINGALAILFAMVAGMASLREVATRRARLVLASLEARVLAAA